MKEKKIANISYLLATLISNIMCATVAYKYCEIQWMIEYRGFSAPASLAFFEAIPFLICILVCLIIGKIENKKHLDNIQK